MSRLEGDKFLTKYIVEKAVENLWKSDVEKPVENVVNFLTMYAINIIVASFMSPLLNLFV